MADGTLKVGTITTSSGSGTITLGQSGETVDMSNGTMTLNSSMKNTPAFMVRIGSSQNISTGSYTKIAFDTEVYDTDSKFDTSNYRFTPGVVGKYKFELQVTIDDLDDQKNMFLKIYKNGSGESTSTTRIRASGTEKTTSWCNWSDTASTTDYYEAYIQHDIGSTEELRSDYSTIWMGYRLIGA